MISAFFLGKIVELPSAWSLLHILDTFGKNFLGKIGPLHRLPLLRQMFKILVVALVQASL